MIFSQKSDLPCLTLSGDAIRFLFNEREHEMSRFILSQVKDAAISDKLDMLGGATASAEINGDTVTVYALGQIVGVLTVSEAKTLLVAKRDAQGRPVRDSSLVPSWFAKNRAMWPVNVDLESLPPHVASLYCDEMDRRKVSLVEYYS